MEVLPLSFRPKRLSDMVGQAKLVNKIRGHFLQGRVPKAWMFTGPKGSGKTSLARILAMMFQCSHQKTIGDPCDVCWKKKSEFNIVEINSARFTGKDELESLLDGADYVPQPGSRRRVYILDELQASSKAAKTLLLKYFEDSPSTTKWIVCTTAPESLPETLQSRCTTYAVPGLDEYGVRSLVKKALSSVRSELDSGVLVDALVEANVFSPRLVLVAVEKYTAGSTPEEAARVEVSTEFDVNALFRCLLQGDWEKVANQLREAKPEDVRSIRAYLAKAFSRILLDETDFTRRTKIVADGIKALGLYYGDDSMALASLAATLYEFCKGFKEYKR